MKYAFGLKRRSKKKGMHIYKFEGVKVICLNDFQNRRMLMWFYKESTKQLYRIAMHGYYIRSLRKKLVFFVEGIQNDENYFNEKIMSRRSYSWKRERAFKYHMSLKK